MESYVKNGEYPTRHFYHRVLVESGIAHIADNKDNVKIDEALCLNIMRYFKNRRKMPA
jgi:hypothetical protein